MRPHLKHCSRQERNVHASPSRSRTGINGVGVESGLEKSRARRSPPKMLQTKEECLYP